MSFRTFVSATTGTLVCLAAVGCASQGPKPIDELTMTWAGTGPLAVAVRIKAYKGDATKPLVADVDNVAVGQAVTIAGFAGAPNDIIWEIYAAGTNTLLGKSTFHLSCSDENMNGPEDCGKVAGDGKARTGFVNQWQFDGMAGNGRRLDCGL